MMRGSHDVGGYPGLLSCDWFNPEGSEANTTQKDYEPIPLNAVVVKTWNNETPRRINKWSS